MYFFFLYRANKITSINGLEKIFENKEKLNHINIRFDENYININEDPGQLKNLLNKASLANLE